MALLAMLMEELPTDEQRTFMGASVAFLHYHPRNDFSINLDTVFQWLGYSTKGSAKAVVVKKLTDGKDYKILHGHIGDGGCPPESPSDTIMLTVHGFKHLCKAANTDKARRVREYYVTMEEVLLEYTRRQCENGRRALQEKGLALEEQGLALEEERAMGMRHRTELLEQRATVQRQAEELAKIRTKVYEEVQKLDNVYVNKEVAELASDGHKVGQAIDQKKRESHLNTGSAQGSRMIHVRATHNGKIVEDIVKVVLRRYHIASLGGVEHYHNSVEHSVDVIDIAATVVDTLASSFEYMTRDALLDKLADHLQALRHQDVEEALCCVDPCDSDTAIDLWTGEDSECVTNPVSVYVDGLLEVTEDTADCVLVGELFAAYQASNGGVAGGGGARLKKMEFFRFAKAHFVALGAVSCGVIYIDAANVRCRRRDGSSDAQKHVAKGVRWAPVVSSFAYDD